ncbi:MAG: heme o synthase [Flavobacteriales bacterium]|nr:heme o synthase [Flavobacteriales bacterium]
MSKVRDIATLYKMRLTVIVVLSAFLGYLMGADSIDWKVLTVLVVGGILLTGGSNGFNQVLERQWDALMHRTKDRPIPTGRLSPLEAAIISALSAAIGIAGLWIFINPASGLLGLFSFVSYVFVYTPLKRVSSLAVFVGAIPGAIPPMLGYVAATNDFGLEAGILFALQFIWQFPHFWAIAWVVHEDYQRGGYQLLPFIEGRTKRSAFQMFSFSLALIPVSLIPWALPAEQPLVGDVSAVISVLAGMVMTWLALKLYRSCDTSDARRLMFASFIYLPVVQLFYVIDKIS